MLVLGVRKASLFGPFSCSATLESLRFPVAFWGGLWRTGSLCIFDEEALSV